MSDDAQSLREYAESGSQVAFTRLVERHGGLVYQTAIRVLGERSYLAQDVVQAVFILLAQKARSIARHPNLAGWLHSTTHFISLRAARTEYRRDQREIAAQSLVSVTDSGAEWEQLRGILDEAMLELRSLDREAMLLRYFEGRPIAEIASSLRVTEAAAYKRLERAIERLRGLLARRGITSSAGALATILSAEAATGSPAGMTAAMVGAAMSGCAAPVAGWSLYTYFMSTAKLTLGAIGLLTTIGAGALFWKDHQSIARLAQRNAQLETENRGLSSENAHLSRQLKSNYLSNLADHVRTRESVVAKSPRASEASATGLNLSNVGQRSPRAAVETLAWACDQANTDVLEKLISFGGDGRQQAAAILAALPENLREQYQTPEALYALFFAEESIAHPLPAAAVLNSATESYQARDHVSLIFPNGRGLQFQNTPAGWKFIVPAAAVQQFANQILVGSSDNQESSPRH